MNPTTHWNRRTFLATSGLTAAAMMSAHVIAAETQESTSLACVAYADHLQLFRAQTAAWQPFSEPIACLSPSGLALHPHLDILYVAHDTEHHSMLPRASVSAWSVDRNAGSMHCIDVRPLTLSATRPQHLSVSPNGATLLVSATGGGAYNIFQLAPDGTMSSYPQALKQTGRSTHPLQTSAQPQASIFHPSGAIAYCCDFGTDRLDEIDVSQQKAAVAARTVITSGSGPRHLALHPSGDLLVVASQLQPTLHFIDIQHQKMLRLYALPGVTSAGPLCFDGPGTRLYATALDNAQHTTISAYSLNVLDAPARQRTIALPNLGVPRQLTLHRDTLFVVGSAAILRLDPITFKAHYVLHHRGIASIAILKV